MNALRRVVWVALLSCAWLPGAHGASAQAAGASPMAREVAALLDRLAASKCSFYRNGTWHDAAAAREHLEKKYRYLADRSRIATTEEFIRLGATSSSTSGEAYRVRCGDATLSSAEWLTRELVTLRARQP